MGPVGFFLIVVAIVYLVVWFLLVDRIMARARRRGADRATTWLLAAVALFGGPLGLLVAWYVSGRVGAAPGAPA